MWINQLKKKQKQKNPSDKAEVKVGNQKCDGGKFHSEGVY